MSVVNKVGVGLVVGLDNEGEEEVLALHFHEPSDVKEEPKECALAGGFTSNGEPLLMLWVGCETNTEPLVMPAAAVMAVMIRALGEATTTSLLVSGSTPWEEEPS